MSIRTDLKHVKNALWLDDHVCIKPIATQDDLAYALFECELTEAQRKLVNPAAFSIGRAYLFREDNYPCIIYNAQKDPVGFLNLCKWLGEGDAYSWSYFIDKRYQGKGYGKAAAQLAIQILKAANAQKQIKLSTERNNERAQRLYVNLGFKLLPELDGSDIVFGL